MMATYTVTGYLVTSYTVKVEAKDEATARELGYDLLMDGETEAGDSAWDDDFHVEDFYEEDN
jgi:hypothetical protein